MSLLERLIAHRTVGSVRAEEIEWVAAHGVLQQLEPGSVITSKAGPVDGLHIVLSGHLTIHVDRGAGRRKVMEWHGGDVTGLMPYSRLVAPPADVVAEQPTEVITVYRKDMPAMILACQELTAILVHVMLDRARLFTSAFLHDEKLVSLGKLAAGLAHELNNPASAIARSARSLGAALATGDTASRAIGSFDVTPQIAAAMEKVLDTCRSGGSPSILSPLEQERREDLMASWLNKHKIESRVAEALADTDITIEALDQLASSMTEESLDAAVHWIASRCTTSRLTREIQESATRIYDLVAAIKGFTEMDRAAVAEPVDIGQGLSNTVVVLRSKAKGKSVGLNLTIEKDLPRVNGFGSELNQVWANLIDNALDAVSNGGNVELSANRDRNTLVVRVIDDGPGVPAEIRDRVFDPFFTTKAVGAGTGLGLDIVRRLIQRHNGQIELESKPGRTEFRVTLPVLETPEGNR